MVGRGSSCRQVDLPYTDLVSGTVLDGSRLCDQATSIGSVIRWRFMSLDIHVRAVGLDEVDNRDRRRDASWTTQGADSPNSSSSLRSVSCASTSNCMGAGGLDADGPCTIMSTTDGGATWATVFSFPNSVEKLAAISCPSQSVCTAVRPSQRRHEHARVRIVHTTDGGRPGRPRLSRLVSGPSLGSRARRRRSARRSVRRRRPRER